MIGAFRGLLLGSVLMWYSSTVWKTMDSYYNREFKKYLEKEKEARRIPYDEEICKAPPTAQVPSCGNGEGGAALNPPEPVASPAPTNDASDTRNDAQKPRDVRSHEDGRLEGQLDDEDTCPIEANVLQTP